jgi:hypothetical protein
MLIDYLTIWRNKMAEKNMQPRTKPNKAAMLKALNIHRGIVTHAAEAVGLTRAAHYKWMHNDEDYAAAVKDLDEVVMDFYESALQKKVQEGDTPAIIFAIKCKGKSRGFIEKQHIEHSTGNLDSLAETMVSIAEKVNDF